MQKAPMVGALTKPLFKELQDQSYRFRLEGVGLRAWGLEKCVPPESLRCPDGERTEPKNTGGPKP